MLIVLLIDPLALTSEGGMEVRFSSLEWKNSTSAAPAPDVASFKMSKVVCCLLSYSLWGSGRSKVFFACVNVINFKAALSPPSEILRSFGVHCSACSNFFSNIIFCLNSLQRLKTPSPHVFARRRSLCDASIN